MGYNIGLFMFLVIVIAALVKRSVELTPEQIKQIEVLLRDWPQETMAQISVLGVTPTTGIESFDLQGIVRDSDDQDILEEGFGVEPEAEE